jgi:ferredoxin
VKYFQPDVCAGATDCQAAPRRRINGRRGKVNFSWEMGLAMKESGGHIAGPKKVHFMADAANKYPENTGGKYYVDNQCIDCDLCRETAPDNFKRNDDGGYSFVYKQPENPDEEARCKEAKEGCPVEAIGDNGG